MSLDENDKKCLKLCCDIRERVAALATSRGTEIPLSPKCAQHIKVWLDEFSVTSYNLLSHSVMAREIVDGIDSSLVTFNNPTAGVFCLKYVYNQLLNVRIPVESSDGFDQGLSVPDF